MNSYDEDRDMNNNNSSGDSEKQTNQPVLRGFFHPDIKDARKNMLTGFAKVYVLYGISILSILSIYWGSMFRKEGRSTNLKVLVVNWDDQFPGYLTDNDIQPVIGTAVVQAVGHVPDALGWDIRDDLNDSDIDYVYHLVHQREAWGAIVIHPNSTQRLHQAMKNGDTDFNTEGMIEAVYEQSTDLTATGTYIVPGFSQVQAIFLQTIAQSVYRPLLSSLTSKQKSDLINKAPNVVSAPMFFRINDRLPVQSQLIMAPLQIGLIYLIILSFFQFNFSVAIHANLFGKVKPPQFLLYRWISAQLSYVVISLFYCLLSLAFQIDTSVTFGKSGFLVFWSTNFLGMSAVGGANENVLLVLFAFFPPALGFWLLFWVISNISPAFGPIALCPKFFRYGYAFPVYNILETTRVVLCNTTKKDLGRHIGILIAWIVVNTMLLPFASKIYEIGIRKKTGK